MTRRKQEDVAIGVSDAALAGSLDVPVSPQGLVVFAHGSGSSRFSPRNRRVAKALYAAGFATLLFDLLTEDEEQIDEMTRELRFDIPLLARRLTSAVDWAGRQATRDLPIGLFGASTGAAAALIAAARRPDVVGAVVSRGGRPDLAPKALERVRAPTLLIVGGQDTAVRRMNEDAAARMRARVRVEVVPGASHLFEEPGKLDQVARLAVDWFDRNLSPAAEAGERPRP